MNEIAEIVFWVTLTTGLLSLGLLWFMRQNEQIAQRDDLRRQQDDLREQIAQVKMMLQAQGRSTDQS